MDEIINEKPNHILNRCEKQKHYGNGSEIKSFLGS